MIEVAEVFRRFAADYLEAHGASMLPSHRRAVEDILACRTAALGGQVWHCEACNTEMFSYHSCGNRSCPKCHTTQTQDWLERRQAEMPPVPYFHITVTVPAGLREVRIASPEMLPGAYPLPHLTCSPPVCIGGGGHGADQHVDTRRVGGCAVGTLCLEQPEGTRTDSGRVRGGKWLASQARDAAPLRRSVQSTIGATARATLI